MENFQTVFYLESRFRLFLFLSRQFENGRNIAGMVAGWNTIFSLIQPTTTSASATSIFSLSISFTIPDLNISKFIA
jgi:hypothetical protein